ncbi:TonB-dependent receptor [Sphingobium sp. DEHP117]|uniref:TonB-dependent receptor n=1 Tax=Sphingobium sp. DEHP117 TaxID=2993436 RepID=UPI0027D4D0F4|nr:TonB-dependent receptor [Sphingobium sp. DEHP117]MDQ4420390.1 TonB-dependent receptor [Sphingobium sp. DEHP117]
MKSVTLRPGWSDLAGHMTLIQSSRVAIAAACVSFAFGGLSAPAAAQGAAAEGQPEYQGEILVTARKRQESILKVPVVVSAVSGEQLAKTQVSTITDLPRLVPGLVIGGSILSIGPQTTIRGIGTSSFDTGADQSVSLNVDGMSFNNGLAFGSAMFDVAQVEVLKGPQALFYGKSSTGGVISIRTADPGDKLEIIARGGYEFVAREKRGELVVSTPLTETLGIRLAGMYSDAEGYFRNEATPNPITGARAPDHRRNPQPRSMVLRGTMLFKPGNGFTARLKLNHVWDKAENAEVKQVAACYHPNLSFPFGSGIPGTGIPPAPNFLTPIDPVTFGTPSDCKFDRKTNQVYAIPSFFPGIPNGGTPYLRNRQDFAILDLGYDFGSGLSLSSTTGYYKINSNSLTLPFASETNQGSVAVFNRLHRQEFTQELRLESDYSGPFNFTLGGFYEDGKVKLEAHQYRNIAYGFLSPAIVGADILNDHRQTTVDIRTASVFGQLRYKIFDQLEVAGGLRFSDEVRRERIYDFVTGLDLTPFIARPKLHAKTYSPEITLTYTPTDDLTLFASWKKGYKSGSFDISVPKDPRLINGNTENDNSYDDERVQGFEGGVKARMFDRQLLANLAFYRYRYRGLQLSAIRQQNPNGQIPIVTSNAGQATSYGADFDMAYRPAAVPGLSLNAAIIWNKGKYDQLESIGCYDGQTIAQGCNLAFANGRFTQQNLNGTPMVRAPEWSGNFGFSYEMPVGSGMKVTLSNNNQFSSKYVVIPAVGRPNNDQYQKGYFRTDATLALSSENDRWEIALIGRNLTDKLVASNCAASNVSGGYILGVSGSGTAAGGNLTPIEKLCFPDGPGRSVWVRLTFKH